MERRTERTPEDQQASRLALACGVVASAVVAFWLIRILQRGVRADFDLWIAVADLGLVAPLFFLRAQNPRGPILLLGAPLMTLPMFAVRFAHDRSGDLGLAGACTFAAAIGLLVAGAILEYIALSANAAVADEKRRELDRALGRSRRALGLLSGLALGSTATWLAARPPWGDVWGGVIFFVATFTAAGDMLSVAFFARTLKRLGAIEAR
jgi:hypothetical protein